MSSDHIYKKIEIVGSSSESTDDAIRNAIAACKNSINHMDWFEVIDTRGDISNGEIAHFQVTLKIGFRIDKN